MVCVGGVFHKILQTELHSSEEFKSAPVSLSLQTLTHMAFPLKHGRLNKLVTSPDLME